MVNVTLLLTQVLEGNENVIVLIAIMNKIFIKLFYIFLNFFIPTRRNTTYKARQTLLTIRYLYYLLYNTSLNYNPYTTSFTVFIFFLFIYFITYTTNISYNTNIAYNTCITYNTNITHGTNDITYNTTVTTYTKTC